MTQLSKSKNLKEVPKNLADVYRAKEQRTYNLVRESVDALFNEKVQISLNKIVAKSKELDPQGKGVSISAIQRNEPANAYYKKHRTYQNTPTQNSSIVAKEIQETDLSRIKADRNISNVRSRYLKMSREALVDRLLLVEHALAKGEDLWHTTNDEILTLRLSFEETTSINLTQIEAENRRKLIDTVKKQQIQIQDLQAQLIAHESLMAESEELRKQVQYLQSKLIEQTTAERSKNEKQFKAARSQTQKRLTFPEVDF